MPHGTFDGFIRGQGAIYTGFWDLRLQDLKCLTPSRYQALVRCLDDQVFGLQEGDDAAEIERQMAFSRAKVEELRAEKDESGEDESGDQEEGDVKNRGQDSDDKGEGTSQGK